jgi:hypothetical protein
MGSRSFLKHDSVMYVDLDSRSDASHITDVSNETKRGVLSTGRGMWWDLAVHFDIPTSRPSDMTTSRPLDQGRKIEHRADWRTLSESSWIGERFGTLMELISRFLFYTLASDTCYVF